MKQSQIALQLYTIRAHTKDLQSFVTSMRRVRELGYGAVQISGTGPIPASELRRVCDDEGLVICATHEPGKTIVEDPRAVVDRLGTLGCRHTAYPYPHVALASESDVLSLASSLNAAGEVLARAGMTLTYHNHAIELKKAGGRTLLEILYAASDPRLVQGEIDVYWIQAGGGDPVAWCERLSGRLPLLHLKDYGVGADDKPRMAEVGYGNLDMARIVRAATAAGCQWFIVEQDEGFEDAFESAGMSLRYLSALAED
ncbi:MAG TPA: sugar phosphate isomerase/epimerase [Polyangiaceae bacterium]|nr:sugar phosphate isomerase/epimerase [Polyangiaceae bacterium]